jgi:hypothetical protein
MALHARRTLKPQPPPDGVYETRYSDELANLICTRLAAGESLRAICRTDPALPTEKTVWNWRQQRADFAYLYEQAVAFARAKRREQVRTRAATRKAEKAAIRAARGWKPMPEWPDTYSPQIAELICERLIGGEALHRICPGPGMPSLATVYNWLKRHPEFAEMYRRSREFAYRMADELARETSPWLGRLAPSVRELKRRERAVLRRRGQLWPRAFEGPPRRRELEVTEGPIQPDGSVEITVAWADEDNPLLDPKLWDEPK